jgi:hypothetical protein
VTDGRAQLRRSARFPLSTSGYSARRFPAAAIQVIGDALALRLDTEAGIALLIGRDPEIGNELAGGVAVLWKPFPGDELQISANIGKYKVCSNMSSYKALRNFIYCLYSRS